MKAKKEIFIGIVEFLLSSSDTLDILGRHGNMHVVYQPLWRIVLHSLFIDRELVLSYSFKIILNSS